MVEGSKALSFYALYLVSHVFLCLDLFSLPLEALELLLSPSSRNPKVEALVFLCLALSSFLASARRSKHSNGRILTVFLSTLYQASLYLASLYLALSSFVSLTLEGSKALSPYCLSRYALSCFARTPIRRLKFMLCYY